MMFAVCLRLLLWLENSQLAWPISDAPAYHKIDIWELK
ncbi:hypothetical protein CLOLEP_00428 [[Clostridium] leptum DSM 753]|uniref:Uncharacterized protein n=1 Tax=[Clostridium] leptum DSM 753 TaxID=428125 RepID=A7VPF2_9FIRM|nr:hypothetical protein CLOLEP_00428 [[Clostridium] leptum DSM 753]